MQTKIHLGKIIHDHVSDSGMTHKEFSDKLHLAERSVYALYNRPHIRTDDLIRICELLEHDFFADISNAITHVNFEDSLVINDSGIERTDEKAASAEVVLKIPIQHLDSVLQLFNQYL